MKILIFYQYFGTPKGGWSTRYYEFARRWVKSGHEVTIVTSPYYKSDIKAFGFISEQNLEGIKLIVINSPDSNKDSFLKRMFNAVSFSFISLFYSLTLPADCVISSSGPITTALPGIFAKILRNTKFVFEVRDLWPRGGIELGKLNNPLVQKIALSFEKFIYCKSDLIIACSPGMEQGVLDVCQGGNTLVIPNSSDLELFDNSKGTVEEVDLFEPPIFIYAGSLGYMDECSQILYGLKILNRKDFIFLFIGDGAEKEHLENLVKEFNLQDQVEFLGLIPKTEVVNWFAKATASFVTFKDIPVLHTSSPNKLFDSFAAGVPVIQSTRGWIAELITEFYCGFNVDPNLPFSFAQAMNQFLDNPDLAIEMGRNARKLAELKFDRSVLSKRYLNTLESLIR
jgi:glycosyltransferase involved in cell wall biosynthesis